MNNHLGLWTAACFTAGVVLAWNVDNVMGWAAGLRGGNSRNQYGHNSKASQDVREATDTLENFTVNFQSGKTSTMTGNSEVEEIAEGIEGTIGNTPLIKIKSLSEVTGCEILAKAEVRV
jgi:cysteine synthase